MQTKFYNTENGTGQVFSFNNELFADVYGFEGEFILTYRCSDNLIVAENGMGITEYLEGFEGIENVDTYVRYETIYQYGILWLKTVVETGRKFTENTF